MRHCRACPEYAICAVASVWLPCIMESSNTLRRMCTRMACVCVLLLWFLCICVGSDDPCTCGGAVKQRETLSLFALRCERNITRSRDGCHGLSGRQKASVKGPALAHSLAADSVHIDLRLFPPTLQPRCRAGTFCVTQDW
jgi:hypothetical protein